MIRKLIMLYWTIHSMITYTYRRSRPITEIAYAENIYTAAQISAEFRDKFKQRPMPGNVIRINNGYLVANGYFNILQPTLTKADREYLGADFRMREATREKR